MKKQSQTTIISLVIAGICLIFGIYQTVSLQGLRSDYEEQKSLSKQLVDDAVQYKDLADQKDKEILGLQTQIEQANQVAEQRRILLLECQKK